MKEKTAKILTKIAGWGLLLCLAVGLGLFLVFLAASFMPEETAKAVTAFIKKPFLPYTYHTTVFFGLLGLIGMYLRGQKTMLMKNEKKEAAKKKSSLQDFASSMTEAAAESDDIVLASGAEAAPAETEPAGEEAGK